MATTEIKADLHYFIPASHLGVLEHQFKALLRDETLTKRKREAGFKRFARLMYDLNLVGREYPITNISFGIRSDGELGLIVVGETTKVEGQLMPPDPIWQEKQDLELLARFDAGENVSAISEALSRTFKDVRARLVHFGRVSP